MVAIRANINKSPCKGERSGSNVTLKTMVKLLLGILKANMLQNTDINSLLVTRRILLRLPKKYKEVCFVCETKNASLLKLGYCNVCTKPSTNENTRATYYRFDIMNKLIEDISFYKIKDSVKSNSSYVNNYRNYTLKSRVPRNKMITHRSPTNTFNYNKRYRF
jgi:hypothetical protein